MKLENAPHRRDRLLILVSDMPRWDDESALRRVVADGTYRRLNVNSGQAVDVSGGSTADGAAIIQRPYSVATDQQWLISIAP